VIRILATIGLLLATLAPATGFLTTPPAAAQQGLLPGNPATLTPNYRDAVYGNFLQAGNGVLRCPVDGEETGGNPASDCLAATDNDIGGGLLDNRGNNNGYYLHQADVDDADATFNSTSAELTIPAGATVRYAQLHWGGHTGTFVGFSGVNCARPVLLQGQPPPPPAAATPSGQQVTLSVDGAAPAAVPLVPQHFQATEGLLEATQIYTNWADVTARFDAVPTGERVEVSVGNVWAPSGPGCAGGWSLVVVFGYDEPTGEYQSLRVVDLYTDNLPKGGALTPGLLEPLVPGFPSIIDGLLPGLVPGLTGTSVILPGVNARRADAAIEIGLTAYDGDWSQGGDTLTVDGDPVTDPCLNDTAEDFFRSCANYAIDPIDPTRRPMNNLSVESKTFIPDLADNDTGEIELGVNSLADFFVMQNVVLAESIDPAVSVTNTGPVDPVRQGDLATFDIEITNTGSLPLFDVELVDTSDPASDDIRCTPEVVAPLDPGESAMVTCVQSAGDTDFVNTATVTAAYLAPAGGGDPRTVTASDSADPVTVEVPDYAVRRVPSSLVVRAGEPVTFTVTLINNTDLPFTEVEYTDDPAAECVTEDVPTELPPLTQATFECVVDSPQETFTSSGSMVGTDGDDEITVFSQEVTVVVIEPTLTVGQESDKDVIYRGDTVELTFTVANEGDADDERLGGVTVSVPDLPDCEPDPVGELAPGESATVTCTAAPDETIDVVTEAVGTDVTGGEVTARSEPTTITVLDPLLELTQDADPRTIRVEGQVTFTFTATHLGDDEDGPLSDVQITNPTLPPDCELAVIEQLDPGASETRECTVEPDRTFDSVALASAVDQLDRPMRVTSDPLRIRVINPAMTINTEADPEEAKHGADVDFIVTVRNIGDVALTLDVANDNAPDCDFTLTDDGLPPGAARGRQCTTTTPTGESEDEFTNVAEFSAEPVEEVQDEGEPIVGQDDATIRLLAGQAPTEPPDDGSDDDSDDGSDDDSDDDSNGGSDDSDDGPGEPQGSGGLADTGTSLVVPLAMAVSLLVAGALMLAVAARRHEEADEDSFLYRWWPGN